MIVDKSTFSDLLKANRDLNAIYDDNGKYNFLNQSDIIEVSSDENNREQCFIMITTKYKMKIKNYLEENPDSYFKNELIEKQLRKKVSKEEVINIYEFERSYNHIHD